MIRHIVFFSIKRQEDLDKAIEGLELLRSIKNCAFLEVTSNLKCDQINNDIDIIVYSEFEDLNALKLFKQHTLYQQAIDIVRPLRKQRYSADIKTQ